MKDMLTLVHREIVRHVSFLARVLANMGLVKDYAQRLVIHV